MLGCQASSCRCPRSSHPIYQFIMFCSSLHIVCSQRPFRGFPSDVTVPPPLTGSYSVESARTLRTVSARWRSVPLPPTILSLRTLSADRSLAVSVSSVLLPSRHTPIALPRMGIGNLYYVYTDVSLVTIIRFFPFLTLAPRSQPVLATIQLTLCSRPFPRSTPI